MIKKRFLYKNNCSCRKDKFYKNEYLYEKQTFVQKNWFFQKELYKKIFVQKYLVEKIYTCLYKKDLCVKDNLYKKLEWNETVQKKI